MILSLLTAAITGLMFFAIGSGIYKFLGPSAEHPLVNEMTRLTGLAVAFVLASLAYELELPPFVLLGALAALTIFGLPYLKVIEWSGFFSRFTTFLRVRATAFVAAASYALVMQGSLGNVWTFRTGPDSFGWGGAALTICRGDTLSALTGRVRSQLQGTDLIASFARPVKAGELSIAQISSFSDQAAAEFLIGAHRTGLPKLLGDICAFAGESVFAHLFVAFVALSVYVVTRIIRRVGREYGLKPLWADLIALSSVMSVGALSVTLEGGYGQLVTLPFFVLAVAVLQHKNFSDDSLIYSLALLGLAAMSSYLDLLYLAIPMLLGIYLTGVVAKQYSLVRLKWRHALIAFMSLLLSWPMLVQLARLALSAAANPRAGGWDQGRFFLPDNVFGVVSSLPVGHYEIIPRSLADLGIDLIFSALVLALIFLTLAKQRILGIFLMFGYLFLSYGVYAGVMEPNNYRVWKYSAYAGILFSFILIGVAARAGSKQTRVTNKSRRFPKRFEFAVIALVTISALGTSLNYSLDWSGSSAPTADGDDKKLIKELAPDYDLAFGPGLYSTMFTMFGDVRFATLNRGGAEIGNVVRDNEKPLAVILSNDTVPTLELLNGLADGHTYVRFQELSKGDTLTAYLLSRD